MKKVQTQNDYDRLHPYLLFHIRYIARQCLSYILPATRASLITPILEQLYCNYAIFIHRQSMRKGDRSFIDAPAPITYNISEQGDIQNSGFRVINNARDSTVSMRSSISAAFQPVERKKAFQLDIFGIPQSKIDDFNCLLQAMELVSREIVVEDFLWRDHCSWAPHVATNNTYSHHSWIRSSRHELNVPEEDENGQFNQFFPREFLSAIMGSSANELLQVSPRFSRILDHFGDMRVSTSPFVFYPPPHIFKRLGYQEMKNNCSTNEPRRHRNRTVSSDSISIAPSIASITPGSSNQLIRSSSKGLNPHTYHSTYQLPPGHEGRFILNPSDRVSLASLNLSHGSARQFLNNQEMTLLKSVYLNTQQSPADKQRQPDKNDAEKDGEIPISCLTKLFKTQYYGDDDTTLSQYLEQSVENADKKCSSCHQKSPTFHWQHKVSYVHGTSRVTITIQKQKLPLDISNGEVWVWCDCAKCKMTLIPKKLSSIASAFSFTKYLEQIMYNPMFLCHGEKLCSSGQERWTNHTVEHDAIWELGGCPSHKSYIKRNFYLKEYMITFHYDQIKLHEIAIASDNINVSHEIGRRESTASTIIHESVIQTAIQTANSFFDKITSALGQLKVTGAPSSRKSNRELDNFNQRLRTERRSIIESIEAMGDTEAVNDFLNGKLKSIEKEYHLFRNSDNIQEPPTHCQLDSSYARISQKESITNIGDAISLALSAPIVKEIMFNMMEMFNIAVDDEFWPKKSDETESTLDTAASVHPSSSEIPLKDIMKKWNLTVSRMKKLQETGKYEMKKSDTLSNGFEEAWAIDGMHIEYRKVIIGDGQMMARSAGTLNPVEECRVQLHYAVFFEILRKKYDIPIDYFTETLENLSEWNPSGGKSSASFWKSENGHFILKDNGRNLNNMFSVSNKAVTTNSIEFLSKYLAYILFDRFPVSLQSTREAMEYSPSLLVPILGSLSVKLNKSLPSSSNEAPVESDNSQQTTRQIHVDLMIMENLFNGRSLKRQYDLKGIHGRSIQSSTPLLLSNANPFRLLFRRGNDFIPNKNGESKETLGDDYFAKSTSTSNSDPIYVHFHSRHLLLSTMKEDLSFLSQSKIIDYSLLVGVDVQGYLVVGIVDYLTEYGILRAIEGNGKRSINIIEYKIKEAVGKAEENGPKDTTVQSPQKYAQRMLDAMDTYFPSVPNKWNQS